MDYCTSYYEVEAVFLAWVEAKRIYEDNWYGINGITTSR